MIVDSTEPDYLSPSLSICASGRLVSQTLRPRAGLIIVLPFATVEHLEVNNTTLSLPSGRREKPPISLPIMAGDNENHAPEKIEAPVRTKIPYWRLVTDQGVVTQEIIDYQYPGAGTDDDPYAITWIQDDPRNPMLFSEVKKWTFTMLVAIATLAVALVSSAYTGGVAEIESEFQISSEVAVLGVSLFVLGFAVSVSPELFTACAFSLLFYSVDKN